ncbi:MAG TPA: glycine cleavage system protein GcvH [archaeon]|nr:glycine cleavage system protein GcvH [archaeon]
MFELNPHDRKYTKEHEWVKIENGIATMGITDYAQHALTDIVFVELPEIGKHAQQFKAFAVLESVKSVSDVYAPVSGEIIEVNSSLPDAPEKINNDAFGIGWIAKIKVKDEKELDNLMSAHEYDEYLKKSSH